MNSYDVKRFGLLLSVQAEIEAMKAENFDSQLSGNNTFSHKDFSAKSEELRNLSYCHDEQL